MADDGGARDHAAALADLRRLAARRGPDRQLAARGAAAQAGLRASTRWKNIAAAACTSTGCAARGPERVASSLLAERARAARPRTTTSTTHFTPRYNPWDQRLCLVPDGDLFEAIRDGRGRRSSPTRSRRFTETGIQLESGEELEADIIVTATGLELQLLGGMEVAVDGEPVDLSRRPSSYKGMMFSGVPNLACVFGYTNASWTLKADLVCDYVCRLLNHMEANGEQIVTPVADPEIKPERWIDFSSGYVQRALDNFPKQGSRPPWKLYQNYFKDILLFRFARLADDSLRFSKAGRAADAK